MDNINSPDHWFNNLWLIAIISGLIATVAGGLILLKIVNNSKTNSTLKLTKIQFISLFAIGLFIIYTFNKEAFTKSISSISTILKEIIFFISSIQIYLYWSLGAIITIVVIWILIAFFLERKDKKNDTIPTSQPTINGMSSDEYYKIKAKEKLEKKLKFIAFEIGAYIWKWEWKHNNLINKYQVKNLQPCCTTPSCDNEALIQATKSKKYKCPSCKECFIINTTLPEAQTIIEKEVAIRTSPFYDAIKRNQERVNNSF